MNTHPLPSQQGIAYDHKSPTEDGHANVRWKNKAILNRQNSGLSTSIPLPPITKGESNL